MSSAPPVRFAVMHINHPHIYAQADALLRNGGELVALYAPEDDLAARFLSTYPQARRVATKAEILEDPSIEVVVTSGIPCERAPLGIEVMRAGKDFMSDKPGLTSFQQLEEVRRVQSETGRIYSIMYSERLDNGATLKAIELINAGAIGSVVHTIGTGPHRIAPHTRPPWFFVKEQYGGILVDIASHQIDQFLAVTGATDAEIVTSQVANWNFPQYPELEDFGDFVIRSENASGYVRVDWFTPNGLATWGDARLIAVGTDGYIEVRKYIDVEGKPGANHLILVDHKGTQYIQCEGHPLPYGRQFMEDVRNRTETAMTQAHVLKVAELALIAESKAIRLGNLAEATKPRP